MKCRALALLMVLSLSGCAPPGLGSTAPLRSPSVDTAGLRREMANLPGARVGEEEPPVTSYPGEVLFAEGAAVPLAGGTALLDPLAAFMAARPDIRWQVTVRARTGQGEENDLALAAKRAELLTRYLEAKGVPAARLDVTADAAEGAPLELAPAQPARDASSSRSKP